MGQEYRTRGFVVIVFSTSWYFWRTTIGFSEAPESFAVF